MRPGPTGRAAGKPRPLGRAGNALLDIFFPGRCLLCGEWLPQDGSASFGVCPACLVPLSLPREHVCPQCGTTSISEEGPCTRCRSAGFAFPSNTALFPFSGAARRLLNAFKFGGRFRLADFFAERAIAMGVIGDVGVVPVPARPRKRTPDAVALVCRSLVSHHGVRVLQLLERRGGAPQKTLDLRQRRENLRGHIALRTACGPVPSEVVLLDDVFTTGATLDACATVLRNAGCQTVRCLTLVIEE